MPLLSPVVAMTKLFHYAATRLRGYALLVAALVLVAGCGREEAQGTPASAPRDGQKATAGGQAGGQTNRPPMPVEVAVVRQQRVEDIITGTGEVEAVQSIELRPEVEGRVVEVLFRDGQRVAEGDALFRVDDAELRAQVARAEAERDLAAQSLARQRLLMQSQSSTTSDLEQAEATARASQASLDLLKLRLDRTIVRAPFAGVLGARRVGVGDFVNSQTQLVMLQTISPMRVAIDVPERYAEALRTGLRIVFTVAALRNREFVGTVDFVNPVVRQPGRTITVRGVVQNPRGELQPGMFAEGRLIAAVRERATVVPEDAILPLQGRTFVWVIADDKATRRPVVTGVRTPGFVELTEGVQAGENVVVGGLERLTEGAAVIPRLIERVDSSGR